MTSAKGQRLVRAQARVDSNSRPLRCQSLMLRLYDNLQDRGDGLPKYAEVLQDSSPCGLESGSEIITGRPRKTKLVHCLKAESGVNSGLAKKSKRMFWSKRWHYETSGFPALCRGGVSSDGLPEGGANIYTGNSA